MMNKKDVLEYLEENKDERGIQHWKNAGVSGLNSIGIGVTRLKAFAKIGKGEVDYDDNYCEATNVTAHLTS